MSQRGFFGIGVYHTKYHQNIGTLLRSANCFGADFVFTIGRRYKQQSSDTMSTWRHIPLYEYQTIEDLIKHLPFSTRLVGVELHPKAHSLTNFVHFERSCYLLGAEDHGIPEAELAKCHYVVSIPGASRCLNVSVAGSIIMFDRITKSI